MIAISKSSRPAGREGDMIKWENDEQTTEDIAFDATANGCWDERIFTVESWPDSPDLFVCLCIFRTGRSPREAQDVLS